MDFLALALGIQGHSEVRGECTSKGSSTYFQGLSISRTLKHFQLPYQLRTTLSAAAPAVRSEWHAVTSCRIL